MSVTARSVMSGSDATARAWGADDAVTHLYAAHYRGLVRLAALLLRDTAVAEEVVQDAFIAMHGAWSRLEDPDKALAYLRRSALNGARSALRRREVAVRLAPAPAPDEPSAEYGALVALEHQEMLRALRALPLRQCEVLVLRYYADLTEADIADALGISRGAVKSHASRGMAALRAALEETR
jgi:RNA polymerase sigma-70 factor (sigma-E family)